MKKCFLLVLFLARCSMYDLSFDFDKLTKPVFNILSPTEEITTDELEIQLEIGHPDGITAVYIDGEFTDSVEYSSTPQLITYSTKISPKYSDTYTIDDGAFSFDVDIKTKSSTPFSTNVTLIVYRSSLDNPVFDYPMEYNENGRWADTDMLNITADKTGAGIKSILDEDDHTLLTVDDDPYDVSVKMNTIFTSSLDKDTKKTIKYVTTSDTTNTYVMIVFEYFDTIKMVRDNEFTVSEWLPVIIYVKDPSLYSHIYIDSPNADGVRKDIADFSGSTTISSLQYTFELAYNKDYQNPDGASKPYTANNGDYNIYIDLYDSMSEVKSISTNITIYRKVMDEVKVEYPMALPSSGVWTDEDVLTISASETGDGIGTIVVSSGTHSIKFSDISSSTYEYTYDIKINDIWFFENPTSPIFGSITVIPSRDNTEQNTYYQAIYIGDIPDTKTYITALDYEFSSLPNAVKNTANNSYDNVWFPLTVDPLLFENYGDNATFTLNWYNSSQSTYSPYGVINSDGEAFTDNILTKDDIIDGTVYIDLSTGGGIAIVSIHLNGIYFTDLTITQPTSSGKPSTETATYIEFNSTYDGEFYKNESTGTYTVRYPITIKDSLYTDYAHKDSFQFYWGGEKGNDIGIYIDGKYIDDKTISISSGVENACLVLSASVLEPSSATVRIKFNDDNPDFDYITIDVPRVGTGEDLVWADEYTSTIPTGSSIDYPIVISPKVKQYYGDDFDKLYFYTDGSANPIYVVIYDNAGNRSFQQYITISDLSDSDNTEKCLYLTYKPNEAIKYDIEIFVSDTASAKSEENLIGTMSITTPVEEPTYLSPGTYESDPAPTTEGDNTYVYYPVIISKEVRETYSGKNIQLYFYDNNTQISVGKKDTVSASAGAYFAVDSLNSDDSTTLYLKLNTSVSAYNISMYANTKSSGNQIGKTISITTPVVESDLVWAGDFSEAITSNSWIYYPVIISKTVYDTYKNTDYNLYFYDINNNNAMFRASKETFGFIKDCYAVSDLNQNNTDTALYLRLDLTTGITYDVQVSVGDDESKIQLGDISITIPADESTEPASATYLSLGEYTTLEEVSGKYSPHVWYPINIDPALYTGEYKNKGNFKLYLDDWNYFALSVDGANKRNSCILSTTDSTELIYIELQVGYANKVRIEFTDGSTIGDEYLSIPAVKASSTAINSEGISTSSSISDAHATKLDEDEDADIDDGYSWYELEIDTSKFASDDYISIVTKNGSATDYTVLDIVYIENTTLTKDNNLRAGNINSSKTYYVALPDYYDSLYLKKMVNSTSDPNPTYTKLN